MKEFVNEYTMNKKYINEYVFFVLCKPLILASIIIGVLGIILFFVIFRWVVC